MDDDLNPAQRDAVEHGEGPVLIVAGAGSGKTRVITRRVARLIERGVPTWQICALTFTNKAAREMRSRIEELVFPRDLWICTFHSFAARVLRRWADRLGYDRSFTIYDIEDRRSLIKTLLKEQGAEDLRPAAVETIISRIKNGMADHPEEQDRFAKLIDAYERRMRQANAMDFDDLLINLALLLGDHEEVRGRLRLRASWLLVDEYQDTNAIQYRILRLLAGEDRNVCATGDPDQSVYGWRGATIRNILDFERDFEGARVITLDRNYRSTKSILAVANAVIRHNVSRYEKDLTTENPTGATVREIRCRDDVDEASAIAGTAVAWIEGRRRPKDIAVFYRTNWQSRSIERALRERGLPYHIVGAVEFYKRKEVKDVLAYARVAVNPTDVAAFRRIFNTPARGLGQKTEERVWAAARQQNVSPREVLRDRAGLARFGRTRKKLEQFAELLDALEAEDGDVPRKFLDAVLERTGYMDYLGTEADRKANVEELVNAAAEYAVREPEGAIGGFLEENALISDQDTIDDRTDSVTLMTVHAAKGLEFPCVAVVGLEEEVFPHALSVKEDGDVEEERRLFYVAVTRAREELVLMHAARRIRHGLYAPCVPSRFLDEIPDEQLEVDDRAGDPFVFDRGAGAGYEVDPSAGDDEGVAYDIEKDSGPTFRAGDRVRHGHFGIGRILAVRKSGGGTRVTVDFNQSGRRELSLEYARLERL